MARDNKGITQVYLSPTHEQLPLLPSRTFISVYCFYCMLCMLSAFGANKLHHYRPLAGTQLRLPTEG